MLAVTVFAAGAASACTKHGAVDFLTEGAFRPPPPEDSEWLVLAGDVHCHVSPPDSPRHVSRSFAETWPLAEAEGLDFVVLTPHQWSEFFSQPDLRAESLASWRVVREAAGGYSGSVMFIPGLEWTTRSGHVTMAFGDLEASLARVDAETSGEEPGVFLDAWAETGGLLFVNHPLLLPIEGIPLGQAQWDLSWRLWTARESWPRALVAADERAIGWEAENLAVSRLRDHWLLRRPGASRRAILRELDRRSLADQRRMVPVGGSDSHSFHLRASMFVLAKERTPQALRDAIASGRTCVRSPDACGFEARSASGRPAGWNPVGSALPEGPVEVRLRTGSGSLLVDGLTRSPLTAVATRIDLDAGCHVLRAETPEGSSAHIYVGCAWAERSPELSLGG